MPAASREAACEAGEVRMAERAGECDAEREEVAPAPSAIEFEAAATARPSAEVKPTERSQSPFDRSARATVGGCGSACGRLWKADHPREPPVEEGPWAESLEGSAAESAVESPRESRSELRADSLMRSARPSVMVLFEYESLARSVSFEAVERATKLSE